MATTDLGPLTVHDPVSLAVSAGMRFVGKPIILSITRAGDKGYETAGVGKLLNVRTLRTGGFDDNRTAFQFEGGAEVWVNKGDTVEIQKFGLAQ